MDEVRAERLFVRACFIQEGKAKGLWLPIVRHLAVCRQINGMIYLANWLSDKDDVPNLGRRSDPFSAFQLYRRAWKAGHALAAQNLAMDHFNRNDLVGYRMWLRRAARSGDADALLELRHFETRLPHKSARRIGRIRPFRRSEKLG